MFYIHIAITMRGESTFLVRVETKVEKVKNGSACYVHTGISYLFLCFICFYGGETYGAVVYHEFIGLLIWHLFPWKEDGIIISLPYFFLL